MSKIQDKLAQVTQACDAALQALQTAREGYENGSGKAYAALRARQDDLRTKIAQHQEAAEAAQAKFKRLFAQADHVVNKEVKNALFLKNDALAIAEELANALAESESASFEPMVAASKDAQTYDAAYRHAAAAFTRREVYRALPACENAMARAVALARHVPLPETLENITANVDEARMAFVWKELKDMALTRPEAERFPMVEELGSLDLGAFASRQFLSVAKVTQLRGIQAQQRDAEMGNASGHEGTAIKVDTAA